jgi:hypothetical protein
VALRGGYGFKRYYSEKASKNGVAIALTMSGGPSLALMIPYYLEIGSSKDQKVTATKYSIENEKIFLDPYRIKGSSGFFTGIGETSVVPGAYGQIGLHLDWGAFDEFLRAAEIGIQIDVYAKRLPIIVESPDVKNRPFFFNLYLSLQLGKRN